MRILFTTFLSLWLLFTLTGCGVVSITIKSDLPEPEPQSETLEVEDNVKDGMTFGSKGLKSLEEIPPDEEKSFDPKKIVPGKPIHVSPNP